MSQEILVPAGLTVKTQSALRLAEGIGRNALVSADVRAGKFPDEEPHDDLEVRLALLYHVLGPEKGRHPRSEAV